MTSRGAIILYGANGQLGARLATSLEQAGYEVTALDRAACDFETIDPKKIEIGFRAVDPLLVINAVAYTAVDKAESETERAMHINAEVPGWIAACAQSYNVPMVHFSTDYVFDGVRGRYSEDAEPNPINQYGKSKLEGEKRVRAAGGYVFRLQWVYDNRGRNFFLTMRGLLQEKPELRIVADQIGAPTPAGDIAAAITQLLPQMIDKSLPSAIYHLAARGFTSWHGFTCAIAQTVDSNTTIVPITSKEYPLPAARPLDGRLNTQALAEYGVTLPHWRHALDALLKEKSE